MDHDRHEHPQPGADVAEAESAIDPVCGMKVDQATSKHRLEHAGAIFHFCPAGCRKKFAASPETYLEPAEPKAPEPPKGTIYTCPMHPEIRRDGPGSCPI